MKIRLPFIAGTFVQRTCAQFGQQTRGRDTVRVSARHVKSSKDAGVGTQNGDLPTIAAAVPQQRDELYRAGTLQKACLESVCERVSTIDQKRRVLNKQHKEREKILPRYHVSFRFNLRSGFLLAPASY